MLLHHCSGAKRAGPHQLQTAVVRRADAGQRPLRRVAAQRRAAQQEGHRRGWYTIGILVCLKLKVL